MTPSQALVPRNYPPFFFCLHIHFQQYFFIISSLLPCSSLFVSIFIQYNVNITLHVSTSGLSWHGITLPPLLLSVCIFFSTKFLYFFFISSLFPYFNLLVSIFIQSYANINLHVSTLYIISTFIVGSDTCAINTEG